MKGEQGAKEEKSSVQKIEETSRDMANAAKDTANLTKNVSTGNYLGAAKNTVKLLKNKRLIMNLLLSVVKLILVPILIAALIAGLFMFVISAIGDGVSEVVSSCGEITSGSADWFSSLFDSSSGKFIITINDKKFEEIKATLASQGINAESSNLTDECLKLFLIAQYKTQYPEDVVIKIEISDEEKQKIEKRGRGSNIETEGGKYYIKTQGCIELYRPEFTGGKIRYTDQKTLDEYVNGTKSFDDVKNKYTIDSNGNLVLPQKKEVNVIEGDEEKTAALVDLTNENDGFDWDSFNKRVPTSATITPSLTTIPYQSIITPYTMPFEFLTILTTFTQNSEFGVAVAELVNKESKIKLNVLDNSKTTQERETYQHTSHTKVLYRVGAEAYVPEGQLWIGYSKNIEDYIDRSVEGLWLWKDNKYNYETKIHYIKRKNTITREYTSTIQLEYAETWLVKKETSYSVDEEDPHLDNSVQVNPQISQPKTTERYKVVLDQAQQDNYTSLQKLYDTNQEFKKFINDCYKKDTDGLDLNNFRDELLKGFDKNTMIQYVDEYVENDLMTNFYDQELNMVYSETLVGPPYLDTDLKKEYYQNLVQAIQDYQNLNANSKINQYDVMPVELSNKKENDQTKKAYYVSNKKYKVTNVGDVKDNTDEFLKLLVTGSKNNKKMVYYTNDAGSKKAPAADLLSAPDMFFEIMAGNTKTANLENAMRYIFYRMTDDDSFGVTDIKSAFVSMSAKTIGANYDVTDQSLWITSRDDLISAIKSLGLGGKAQQNLIDNVDAFLQMQSTYKVNAALAISVTIAESSAGTNWAAIDPSTYNWMSITGSYNGQSIGSWRKYPSFREATLDFGDLISGSIYCGSGNTTISQIGNIYCPNTEDYPTQADTWISNTQSSMTKILRAGGVDLSKYSGGIDSSGVVQFALSQVGKGIYDVLPIGTNASDGIATYYGDEWCAMFVSFCFDSCGLIPSVLEHSFIGCTSATQHWITEGKMLPKESYTPKAGDIIFYGNASSRYHTGIVTDCDGTYVYTVEGNSGSGGWWGATKVVTHQYPINYGEIYGYYTASEF